MDTYNLPNKEAVSRSSAILTVDIPASADGIIPGKNSQTTYGQSFYVVDTIAQLFIQTDVSPAKPYLKGNGEDFMPEFRFNRLEFSNYNLFPLRVKLWTGFGRYIDNNQSVLEAYTQIYGTQSTVQSIANGAQVDLSGLPVSPQIQRKSVVVSNLDTNGALYVVDTVTGFLVCAIFGRTSITLPISNSVSIRNESGSSINCIIGQIWYVGRS